MMHKETIVACATSPGNASVGIVRVSGPNASIVAEKLIGHVPPSRQAVYVPFKNADGLKIDQGLALFFKSPNSFTGEDVLELQGHGGTIIIQIILDACLATGKVRLARPGEFSEQAFLNDKMDLTQAEAIADLINASSEQAALSAVRSLTGEFSNIVNQLVNSVVHLRMYVEAAIDFPEEEIDFLGDKKIKDDLNTIISQHESTLGIARQGSLLRDGMHVVIVGKPNAGKSSLLNALSGTESAIVTDIEGTTRDVIKEFIHIDGMPLHIIDTAGIRQAKDEVERIGIDRTYSEIEKADKVLFILDATVEASNDVATVLQDMHLPDPIAELASEKSISVIRNKCDLSSESIGIEFEKQPVLRISAKQNAGIDLLKNHLKESMGFQQVGEGQIIARKRHIHCLQASFDHVQIGQQQLNENMAGELLAEELRISQQYLNEITGEFTSDDLLGKIFSSFCIGK
ncbi:MAG: tRNA uridine-5-carboxymethylaminomethyl(34) synthesis GTPase MnmE [Pseudomonadota bacterium]